MSQHIRKHLCILGALALLLCLSCAPQSPPGNIVDGLGRSVTIDKIVINAQTIKEVYGTEVYVYPHPVNDLPATLIVSDKDREVF